MTLSSECRGDIFRGRVSGGLGSELWTGWMAAENGTTWHHQPNVGVFLSNKPSPSTALRPVFLVRSLTIFTPTKSMRTQYIKKPATITSYRNGTFAFS